MENTSKVLYSPGENQPVWYIALDAQKWIGPMSPSEIIERIQRGSLTWAHYGWKKEQAKWIRLCDIPEFKVAVPGEPSAQPPSKLPSEKTAPPPVPKAIQWFLYYSDSQFGPFTEEELHRFLRIGKIHGDVHAWSEGMTGWQKLKALPEFTESVEESRKSRSEGTPQPAPANEARPKKSDSRPERRSAPRVPLLARSMMAADGRVCSGLCRDVSVGGMQCLTSELPGPVGTVLKLNISTPSGSKEGIDAFVAEGVIVRELEDGKGFSFRFERLSPEGRKAIEGYVSERS